MPKQTPPPLAVGEEQASCVRERLLDVAERLFAEHGVAETSVRDITGEAGANVAAVNYYFGSRRGLFEEVVARRLAPLDHRRRALLEEARAKAAGKPGVEEVLHALVAPSIDLCFEHPYFARLISQLRLSSDQSLWQDYRQSRTEQMQLFHQAFALALPKLPPAEIDTRLHYVIGAIHHIWSRCPLPPSETPQHLLSSFLTFYAAGMRAAIPGR